jgi:hypothetical protein
MTLTDLRRALELLPAGAALTLSRESLLEALGGTIGMTAPDIAPAPPADVEEWLTAEQAAKLLNTSTRWVYDHGQSLGVRKLSRRCVRFSSRAIARRMARRS